MPDILSTAQRLRLVKRATRKFLSLWAAERMIDESGMLERIAADVDRSAEGQVADPLNHNWSLLYRGSVLDD